MNLLAIFADTRPACHAIRTLADRRSCRLSRLASLPAEADGPVYLVGSYAHDNEPAENFPGPEGRAQARVQLRESNYRRIQRFLSGYEVDFTALGILLLHLLPQRPPYEVVIDRTEWHFGETAVNLLMVGIAHKGMAFQGMAFPVAWTALPSGGSSNFRAQSEALERFLEVVDPDSIEVLTADREFISVRWMRRLKDRGIPFAIRLRSDRRIGCDSATVGPPDWTGAGGTVASGPNACANGGSR